jgi:DNA invertase Pin-like site-specific DNA recombinase
MEKMTSIFAYERISDTSQLSGDSYTRQELAIKLYAKANDMKVVKIFKEEMSGTELQRPVLAELMMTLEKNHHGVKTVIIEKLDRLARDLMVQEAIIKDFTSHGFTLISALEGPDLCSNDPSRKAIRQIFGVIAEYEKSILVLKLRAARDRIRAKTGRCEGRKGYQGTEEGQALVKYIKTLYRKPKYGKRKTMKEIAEMLNNEGTLTINKRVWTVSSVRDIIMARKNHNQ